MFCVSLFGSQTRRFRLRMQARDLSSLGFELLLYPAIFGARLIALMRGRDQRFFGLHVQRHRGRDFRLDSHDVFAEPRQFSLMFQRDPVEPCDLRLVLTKLALQRQRPRIALAASGNHPAVVAGTIRRKVETVRIFMREALCRRSRFHQVRRLQSR